MPKGKQAAKRKASAKTGKPFVFISYRRADSAAASRWLYDAIQRTFGPDSVFMDTEAIRVSDEWPHAISHALRKATHLLAVIGPQWLRVTDDYGRRRIDRDDDWVRHEISHALQHDKRILPVLLANVGGLKAEGMPADIQQLSRIQHFELRDERWEADLSLLLAQLEHLGFKRASTGAVRYPQPAVSITEIPQRELSAILRALPGWTEETSPLPGHEPLKRIELRKSFEFGSFLQAIEFMREVSQSVEKVQHHPRWENIWRTVTIWLSTWDIGHKPSQLDVDLAREIERIYAKYERAHKRLSKFARSRVIP
jgi:pterin-4a-carbinolamine dehydratase